jgi:hypothetical protein
MAGETPTVTATSFGTIRALGRNGVLWITISATPHLGNGHCMSRTFRPPPFHPDRPHLVAPVRVDPSGERGPTRSQARGSGWRATSHGYFVPSSVDGRRVDQRVVEAAAVLTPGNGAVTGWAALGWLGARWFDGLTVGGSLPVDLAVWRKIRAQPGIAVCEEGINPAEVIVVDGLPITTPVRSVCFAMRYAATIRDAVRALDMAAYDDLVSIEEMRTYAGTRPRTGLSSWTGIPRCRRATELGDENCWSPQEVTMGMIWVLDAGLGKPRFNVPIFDRCGRHICTPDLLDEEAGVVGEYNGELHLEGQQRARDVRREETYRQLGLEYFTMLAGDSADRVGMAGRMLAARSRAKWLPPHERLWTSQPPAWWTSTETVKQRRALSASQRERYLRYRAA